VRRLQLLCAGRRQPGVARSVACLLAFLPRCLLMVARVSSLAIAFAAAATAAVIFFFANARRRRFSSVRRPPLRCRANFARRKRIRKREVTRKGPTAATEASDLPSKSNGSKAEKNGENTARGSGRRRGQQPANRNPTAPKRGGTNKYSNKYAKGGRAKTKEGSADHHAVPPSE